MIVDLVMWTHNSALNLGRVLNRINQVVPSNIIGQKIIVDDHSIDNTRDIAQEHGWTVYINNGKGLKANIKTALSIIKAPFFASFEHDVLLNRNWWSRISRYMNDKKVAVAQGIRISTNLSFKKLEEYNTNHHITDYSVNLSAQHQSLDNTFCRTDIIRQIGEYNETNVPGIVRSMGYLWFVDHSLISQHIRESFWRCVKHDSAMAAFVTKQTCKINLYFRLALTSPLRSINIIIETKYPLLFFLYPIYRVSILLAVIRRYKTK